VDSNDSRNSASRIAVAVGVEQRLAALVSKAPIVLFTIDPDGVFTMAEGAPLASWGHGEPVELVGRSLFELCRGQEEALSAVRAALGGQERATTLDFTRTAWDLRISPLRDAAGELIGAIGVATDVTERRSARLAHDRLLMLAERARDVLFRFVWSPAPHFEYLSPSILQLTGFTLAELNADPLLAGQRTCAEDFDRLNQVGHSPSFWSEPTEFRWTRKDGLVVWIEVVAVPLLDRQQNVCGIEGIARDITERKRDEAAVREREERSQRAIDGTADGLWDTNLVTMEYYASPRWKAILGHEDHELPNAISTWHSRIHPDDMQRVSDGVTRHLEGLSEMHDIEYRLRHKDGSYRWIRSRGRAIRNERGDPVRLTGFITDIDSQKRTEEALGRSEEQFRRLIETSPDVVVIHRDGHIVYCNQALVQMLGVSGSIELIGKPLEELLHRGSDHAPPESGALLRSHEVRFLRGDGGHRAVEVSSLRVDFYGGPAVMLVGRDVTERNLLQAKLAQADRLASVGTLAAGVAHEINNPLSYTLENLATLVEQLGALGAESQRTTTYELAARLQPLSEIAREAEQGAARVRDIVRDLRMFSRTPEERRVSVDVRAVMESTLQMAMNEIRHRARLVRRYEDDLPAVEANESRLAQVFLNLLINATHAIPEGNVAGNEIVVALRRGDENRVVVEVIDSGIGIAPEHVERIFEPFFTTKAFGAGTGLGLSVCHGIVSSLGGRITVESRPGSTKFCIELPSTGRVASDTRPPSTKRGMLKGIKVLVIDDDPAVGSALARMLARDGAEVERALGISLDDPLDRIARFDVVMCDLMMPDVSGMDVWDRVMRERPELASRFIFMTGGAFTPKSRDFLATLTNPLLDKPFDRAKLRAVLSQLLALQRVG